MREPKGASHLEKERGRLKLTPDVFQKMASKSSSSGDFMRFYVILP
jgi:hypothetical protein